MVWSLLPVVLLNFTSKIQSFQLRLFGNFVCGQKNFMHTFHIWFSWSCVITYLTLRKLLVIQTLLTIDYEPFSQWNFTSVTTIFHFGRFVTSHCGVLFPGETARLLFASGHCLCFLGHWAARAVLFNFSLWRGVGVGFGFRLYDLLQSKDQLPLCACSD